MTTKNMYDGTSLSLVYQTRSGLFLVALTPPLSVLSPPISLDYHTATAIETRPGRVLWLRQSDDPDRGAASLIPPSQPEQRRAERTISCLFSVELDQCACSERIDAWVWLNGRAD